MPPEVHDHSAHLAAEHAAVATTAAAGAGGAHPGQFPLSEPGFWNNLFSPAGYMPRQICGQWTPGEIWLHNASDFFIWTAYLAIPIVLLTFWARKRSELPFRSLFLLFGMFIVACGTTHLMEIVMFYHPIYRFAGLVKLVTAAVSWGTVMALIPVVPHALVMRSPDALEKEVQERTRELEAANRVKDELLEREFVAREEAEAARHEAERAREEAESANRAKDEFLMTLSHELRTPLNAIQGWASLLKMQDFDEQMRKEALDTIERNAWAQAQLVDDILEVSRVTTGKLVIENEPVELLEVVKVAAAAVRPAAESKGIELSVDVQNPALLITGDFARLQQVVWNLLSNAIKFTPRGGKVEAVLRRVNSGAVLEVRDTGEGIEPDFLPHVFERFRQSDSSATRRHGGLGLGLAIVRHIVELHGGEVRAISDGKGQGATFSVTIPLRAVADNTVADDATSPAMATDLASSQSAPRSSATSRPLEGLRLIAVDDEAEARALISTILRLYGAEVRLAASADEAFDLWQQEMPDLIVSDIGMPLQNGYQFMQRLRESEKRATHGTIPTLALTAFASAGDREKALDAGFNAHLSKPVMPNTLVAEVARLAGR